MADEDVATRAPESDAGEQSSKPSIIPGDTKVDQGSASLGEHCTTDRPTRTSPQATQADTSGLTPTGEITKYSNDIDVYVSKPSDYPHSPSKLLLLLTGGLGIHSTNNQLQADKYAEQGFLVVMPDQFAGDPVPSTTTAASSSNETPSIIEQVKLGVASVAKSFTIDMWLARHTPEKVLPILNRVLTSIKEEFADAVANGGGIYAAGYCFGAKYVLLLASELHKDVAQGERAPESNAEEGMVKQGPQIKCGVIAHGTVITKEDFEGVSTPLSIAAVKDDSLFPDDVREAGVKTLKEKGVTVEEKVYEGVPHGFAVLGDYEEQSIKEKQKEAFEQMVQFLKKH